MGLNYVTPTGLYQYSFRSFIRKLLLTIVVLQILASFTKGYGHGFNNFVPQPIPFIPQHPPQFVRFNRPPLVFTGTNLPTVPLPPPLSLTPFGQPAPFYPMTLQPNKPGFMPPHFQMTPGNAVPMFLQGPPPNSHPFPPRCTNQNGQMLPPNSYPMFRLIFVYNQLCLSPKRCMNVNKQGVGLCELGYVCCNFWCGPICVPLFSAGKDGSMYKPPSHKSFIGSNGKNGGYINPELIPKPPTMRPKHPYYPNNPFPVYGPPPNIWNGGGVNFPYPKLPPTKPPIVKPNKPPIIMPTLKPVCKCVTGQFDCNNGQCIALDKVCNGFPNCFNALDESNVFCQRKPFPPKEPFPVFPPMPPPFFMRCKPNEFDCGPLTGKCIFRELVCNGIKDCPNGEDENLPICQNQPLPPPLMHKCFPNQFQCADGSCIPNEYVCDGKSDCKYGKDEMPKFCPIKTKQPIINNGCKNGFRCRNGQCVKPGAQCDCMIDCMDKSDEEMCQGRGDIWSCNKMNQFSHG